MINKRKIATLAAAIHTAPTTAEYERRLAEAEAELSEGEYNALLAALLALVNREKLAAIAEEEQS